jgi:hypothetical protein
MSRYAKLTEREQDILKRTRAMIYAQTGQPDGGGFCGIGAMIVHHVLGNKGYQIMGSDGHWWVERRKDKAILDPTAAQFTRKGRWFEYRNGEVTTSREVKDNYLAEYEEWGKAFAQLLKAHYA